MLSARPPPPWNAATGALPQQDLDLELPSSCGVRKIDHTISVSLQQEIDSDILPPLVRDGE